MGKKKRSETLEEKKILYRFFSNEKKQMPIPAGYDDAFACYVLQITHTELQEQPVEWVEQMMRIHEIKGKVDKEKSDKQAKASKASRGRRR